ncbi:hypothetical protein, partial [Hungatella effluvii]|uniref:hypothetical protein n=1 Tax=Hungatella effluvii TaxID=1096246 RepID=UPI002A7F453F
PMKVTKKSNEIPPSQALFSKNKSEVCQSGRPHFHSVLFASGHITVHEMNNNYFPESGCFPTTFVV